jgi:hypothetical protein
MRGRLVERQIDHCTDSGVEDAPNSRQIARMSEPELIGFQAVHTCGFG